MVRRTDTRRRMVTSAAELFRAQGYHATGLNQLVGAGGAPKGSLYFHFPGGKEQLAAEAITHSSENMAALLREVLEASPDCGTAITQVVEALGKNLAGTDYRCGCPIATVALDAGDSETIRQACTDGYTSWHAVITEYLTGQGIEPGTAATLGTIALSAIEGALLLARTQHDLAPLHAVGEHLRATFARELP
ncbi:TetR/AcrR family transcriptional regulator [Amycolatopsis thermophila]|uniref:TetR/AcrR family transcriptional repressor of lmrAB and yxaGH operons n=1 Tax=Amycolatopsis thermophila TaxID=206084 RepID=A0ABU0EUK9_9PSEU|nr:TetR/AcrR family transcriptional regulator [Amycolatopsis thermophila]MDQ0378971.1 TetR/AcrR family transcriptional repressor of lmrAB and yxaGH operons [Amycolatopsis thermophila]